MWFTPYDGKQGNRKKFAFVFVWSESTLRNEHYLFCILRRVSGVYVGCIIYFSQSFSVQFLLSWCLCPQCWWRRPCSIQRLPGTPRGFASCSSLPEYTSSHNGWMVSTDGHCETTGPVKWSKFSSQFYTLQLNQLDRNWDWNHILDICE